LPLSFRPQAGAGAEEQEKWV